MLVESVLNEYMKNNNNSELSNKVGPAYLSLLGEATKKRYEITNKDENMPSNEAEDARRALSSPENIELILFPF